MQIVPVGGYGAITSPFLTFPSAIGLLVVSLLVSFGVPGLDLIRSDLQIASTVRGFVLGKGRAKARTLFCFLGRCPKPRSFQEG